MGLPTRLVDVGAACAEAKPNIAAAIPDIANVTNGFDIVVSCVEFETPQREPCSPKLNNQDQELCSMNDVWRRP
jgi:hypothetical protein